MHSLIQAIAIGDVRREITFCRKGNINIIGIVENMNGYVCEHCSVNGFTLYITDLIYYFTCQECTNIFSSGGGETLAKYANIDLLISIPIEPKLGECCDKGINFLEIYPNTETYRRIVALANKIIENLNNSESKVGEQLNK